MRKLILLTVLLTFSMALAQAPTDEAKKQFNAGVEADKAGKTDAAIAAYEAALKASPNYPDAHRNLAAAYQHKKEYAKALPHLEAVTDQKSADNLNALGALAVLAKDYPKAVASYEKALVVKPNDPKLMMGLAEAYKKDRQTAKAVETYKKVMATDPKNATARFNLGKIYYDDQEYVPAEGVFKEMMAKFPNDHRGYYMYALSVHSEDPENVEAYQPLYEEVIKRFKGNARAAANVKAAEKVIDEIKNPKKK
ncbi:MAG: tetratricopeptide repeat protein [candidate division Zixibacteria bacterium]|nr:tetratricopeptide repeat protein [candidate division Zixibacteria bacterium]